MLRPAMTQLITKNESCYSLVIGVAKRAREIAEDLYDNGQTLEEKPVKTAVDEFARGEYKIVEETAADEKNAQI
ncbi:MAG: DNA-directed RNA polymerase subunit omega [Oscillospiraceae bacterium]|nr:DNA-directed RNA polymerase subunit omega [Oscillospiraceae bacterium]MBQ7012494.1 DNA-directed RNA polymerase subunit omega [Oscillospiraceae bacterium]